MLLSAQISVESLTADSVPPVKVPKAHFDDVSILVVKSKLPPRSGSSLEAVEPHP